MSPPSEIVSTSSKNASTLQITHRKSRNDNECSPRIDSGIERSELWYISNVSRNGKPVTSSGSSHKRFLDKSVEMKKSKKTMKIRLFSNKERFQWCFFLVILTQSCTFFSTTLTPNLIKRIKFSSD